MQTLLLFALLCGALYYLGTRALLTSWLWSRYPPTFARFMDCSACTGFWYGVLLTLGAGWIDHPLPFDLPFDGLSMVVIGLCMLVVTPLIAGVMQITLEYVGSTAPEHGHPTIAPED